MVTGGENTSGLCAVISDGTLTPGFFVPLRRNKVVKTVLRIFSAEIQNFPNSLKDSYTVSKTFM